MNKRSIIVSVLSIAVFIAACKTGKSIEKTTVGDNVLSKQEISNGWKLLFDGHSLNGWRMYQNKTADAWGVKNGELYCKGSETDKSDLRADIITTDQYENYELSIDWKISPQGNSGIMYHVTEQFDAAYLSGPEYQLIDDFGFPHPLEEWQKTASDYAMYNATSRPTNPVGQYNRSKIVVNGPHREYWLNGIKVLDFEAWTSDWEMRKATGKWKDTPGYGLAKRGHICLQDHGGGVWFKNIKWRPL